MSTGECNSQPGPTHQTGIMNFPKPICFRVWEAAEKKTTIDGESSNNFKFSVLSYNVLAQYLLEGHPYLYTNCSPTNLNWTVRSVRIFDEIISLSPDIICLQEVQATHLQSFYSKLEYMGYCGIFKEKSDDKIDGCAIYFKQSHFKMQDCFSVEFYQPELPILDRGNIGIMVKLVPNNVPTSPIVVATTHLLFNPKRMDVRLAQIRVLLAEIDRFAFYKEGNVAGHLPIILTGDFNSTPDSAVVHLLDKGHVDASLLQAENSDWQRIGITDSCQHLSVFLDRQEGRLTDFSSVMIQNSDYRCSIVGATASCTATNAILSTSHSKLFNSNMMYHNLQLISAYDKVKPDGSIEASTFQNKWVTVDYIYFSHCSKLKLLERLRLPTVEECKVLEVLPNEVYGSDHLALAATFELQL
ncbi:hypothetical protein ACJJTC_002943 [Scirpophaga incertulas]